MRIAYLEDDAAQAALVRSCLEEEGYVCLHYATGAEFQHALRRDTFDLCLLDWELPDISGIEVLGWIRDRFGPTLPVIFTTVRTTETDIVSALNAGADDYLTKPLRRLEMLARIKAVMRRSVVEAGEHHIEMGAVVIDANTRSVARGGESVDLTPKEFDLALFLFRRVGVIVSRGHMLDAIWGRESNLDTRTVDTHVSRIRTKLGLTAEHGWRLSSVQHIGYRLERLDPA